jgi:leucyl aminopeptidase
MPDHLIDRAPRDAIPIEPITEGTLQAWLKGQPAPVSAWVAANGFEAKPGRHLLIPDAAGAIRAVVLGVEAGRDIWSYGGLPFSLPDAV